MPAKRFDLASTSFLESRDGGVSKGGLVRNGFIEAQDDSEVWSWQRPALSTSEVTPFFGTGGSGSSLGLGLVIVGTDLYGIGVPTGIVTASSWSVVIGNNFNVVAGTLGIGAFGYIIANTGTIAPSIWRGVPVIGFYTETSVSGSRRTNLVVQSATSIASLFSTIKINTYTLQATNASFISGSGASWTWELTTAFPAAGNYGGSFA